MYFNSRDIKDGETKMKANPPIREQNNNKQLVESLCMGWIDIISSNHFPVPIQYKLHTFDFQRAMAGVTSLG